MSVKAELIDREEAKRRTEAARLEAVRSALAANQSEPLDVQAERVIAAYRAVRLVLPDDCPHVDPKWGQCAREYGHAPFLVERDRRRGEETGGHYTSEYDDPRRPDGSHPWDY